MVDRLDGDRRADPVHVRDPGHVRRHGLAADALPADEEGSAGAPGEGHGPRIPAAHLRQDPRIQGNGQPADRDHRIRARVARLPHGPAEDLRRREPDLRGRGLRGDRRGGHRIPQGDACLPARIQEDDQAGLQDLEQLLLRPQRGGGPGDRPERLYPGPGHPPGRGVGRAGHADRAAAFAGGRDHRLPERGRSGEPPDPEPERDHPAGDVRRPGRDGHRVGGALHAPLQPEPRTDGLLGEAAVPQRAEEQLRGERQPRTAHPPDVDQGL